MDSNIDVFEEFSKLGIEDDRRRIIIIDYNHLAHRYRFSKARGLSINRMYNGVPTVIDTTIPAYTIKQIVRWSNFGVNPTMVCMDSPVPTRKYYFKELIKSESEIEVTDYKGSRAQQDSEFYQGMQIAGQLMAQGGIYVYQENNYEADDLIFECVRKAKEDFPYLPIDVITGDADLIPLVDEQVSVYMKSKVHTFATETSPLIKGYVQYTPESYQEYAEQLSKFKTSKLSVPYNTILLAKILRGDNADDLKGKPDWKPKMYNELLEILYANDEDVENLARYGHWTSYIEDTRTGEVITEYTDADIPHLMQRYEEPKELTNLLEVIGRYCEPEDVEFVRNRYIGMCLNGAFLDVPNELKRRPYEIKDKTKLHGFDINKLQDEVSILEIRLPMG